MRRRVTAVVLAVAMMLSLGACSGNGRIRDTGGSQAGDTGSSQTGDTGDSQADVENMTFEQMRETAKGTTVAFYSWDGGEKLNQWLDDEFARVMEERYDITMERVPMNIDQILSQLTEETQAGGKSGSIDMIWVNGENFQSAEESNVLYGPFTDKLPDSNDYVDGDSEDVTMDFVYPIEGYKVPYGKAQPVMVADLVVMPDVPGSAEALREFVEKYPGKVVYPAFPSFTGSAFVRNIIYEICGYEQFMDMEEGKETVRAAVTPAMEYLRELNPYLWNQEAAFPDSSTAVDNMFAGGGLVMNITYGAYDVALGIEDGKYADTTATFQFGEGTISNTSFIVAAANSGSKAGAMMATDEVMSPEVQADRYKKLRVIPALDSEKLSGEQKTAFDRVDLGKRTVLQGEFLSERLSGIPTQLVPVIEEIRTEKVMGK